MMENRDLRPEMEREEHPIPPRPEEPHGPHPHGPGPHGPHPHEPGPHGPGPHPHGPGGPHGPGPHGPRPHGPHIDRESYEKLDTDGKLFALIQALGHVGRTRFDERGGQSRVLHILPEEGSMTQRELTERLGIQPGSASELVGKLERAGLIERAPSQEDRRTADVRLTPAGLARRQERPERAGLFTALSDEEKQTLLTLLERLHADWSERVPERPAPPAPEK